MYKCYHYRTHNITAIYIYPCPYIFSLQYFTQNKPVKLFNLERPIVTESIIRIRPIEWFDSSASPERATDLVCIGVGLIGCKTSDGELE